jgi:hypothetical protein
MSQVQATFQGVVVNVELRIGGQPVTLSKQGHVWEGGGQLDLPEGRTVLELSFLAPPLQPIEPVLTWSLRVAVESHLVFHDCGATASGDFLLRAPILFSAA